MQPIRPEHIRGMPEVKEDVSARAPGTPQASDTVGTAWGSGVYPSILEPQREGFVRPGWHGCAGCYTRLSRAWCRRPGAYVHSYIHADIHNFTIAEDQASANEVEDKSLGPGFNCTTFRTSSRTHSELRHECPKARSGHWHLV